MDAHLAALLDRAASGGGRVVVLTGAGISAESGIPTFRGKEGYWTVGSREYQPQQLATWDTFSRDPELVWPWYLYRRRLCRSAQPNAGHEAVVRLERGLGDRFTLVTQNVDGLHLRAGNTPARTYEIHGNIDFIRCSRACGAPRQPLPDGLGSDSRGVPLTDAERTALHCTRCGAWNRPHVLWFDECYDEETYRFESSLRVTAEADLLLVVGTSGATNLPMQMGRLAAQRGTALVDVNPDDNPFADLARRAGGAAVRGGAGEHLPAIAARLLRP